MRGQLFVTVARDPKEEYFPLEAETNDSWTWFINLLLADIGDSKRWTFISDQQKVFPYFMFVYNMRNMNNNCM